MAPGGVWEYNLAEAAEKKTQNYKKTISYLNVEPPFKRLEERNDKTLKNTDIFSM